jgi:hypothetical protein
MQRSLKILVQKIFFVYFLMYISFPVNSSSFSNIIFTLFLRRFGKVMKIKGERGRERRKEEID